MRKISANTSPKKKHLGHPKQADSLLKAGKKGQIELTEKELEKVSGGTITMRKAGKGQQEF